MNNERPRSEREIREDAAANIFAGFALAFRIVYDSHDIALPVRGTFLDSVDWKRLVAIADGETTLVSQPGLADSIESDREIAKAVYDGLDILKKRASER